MCKIMDGKKLSDKIKEQIRVELESIHNTSHRKCSLAVVLIGENPASKIYVNNKIKACELVGIESHFIKLSENATQEEAEMEVKKLAESDIDGILVQLPLPKHLDEKKILDLIPTDKDVDGFCAENIGKLTLGEDTLYSCTPYGVMQILKEYNIDLKGKNAVVIGRSNIVGKPMALLLLKESCTVSICHSKTENLSFYTKNADILVVAIGKAKFVTGDMVKEGAVVIDVGMDRDENGKLCGDVDFDSVSKVCSYITPVPGGVGPMTIAMLMYNTLSAYKNHLKRR